jgi:hypothetical protein
MKGLCKIVEDSSAGPDSTPRMASYLSKSESCEYCSDDSIVQPRTKLVWGSLSEGSPMGRTCLGCNTVMCTDCVALFKPVLKNAFKHDTDAALNQWLYLSALHTDASCASCPACFIPTLQLGCTEFAGLHVDVDKETEYGADTSTAQTRRSTRRAANMDQRSILQHHPLLLSMRFLSLLCQHLKRRKGIGSNARES